eukprot:gene18545-20406_t
MYRLLAERFLKKVRLATGYRTCSSTQLKGNKSALQYCMDIVRLHDYENYLCTLRIQEQARIAAFAIRSFNVELAKIRENISEKHIGSLRLQFWKDVIQEIFAGKARAQPVVLLLFEVMKKHNLTKIWFNRLIEAREQSLEDSPFLNIVDIEKYGENSVSPVLYLLLECLGIKDVHADHTVSHIGKAIGLTTVLRAAPYNLQRRRVYFPLDLMSKHKISQEEIIRGKKYNETSEVVYEIACQANAHLLKAREMRNKVTKDATRVCLPANTHAALQLG